MKQLNTVKMLTALIAFMLMEKIGVEYSGKMTHLRINSAGLSRLLCKMLIGRFKNRMRGGKGKN